MPATRSPKKNQSSVSFRAVKKTASKKGKKAITDSPPQSEVPALDSDDSSASDDDEFELRTPGGKLDEKRYTRYHRSLKPKRGFTASIHTKDQTQVHEILRIFDLSYEYGPCVGVTRLARWERAQKAGLNPPIQVKEILETQEGRKDEALSQNVFYSEGV